MKKNLKLFIIVFMNFVILASIFVFCDYRFFINEAKNYLRKDISLFIYYKNFIKRDISQNAVEKMIMDDTNFHPVINENNDKKSILLFGCSYTYGHQIPENTTPHYYLAKYTNRPVYDRSFPGWGINQMLYQLRNKKLYDIVKVEPEYIIYTYIMDHIRRLYTPCLYTLVDYRGAFYKGSKDKDGNNILVRRKDSILYERSALYSYLKYKFYESFIINDNLKKKVLTQYFLEIKKEADKHWKNTKFIIIEYYEDGIFNSIKPELEKAGYIIVNRNKLVPFERYDTKYCLSADDDHPNDKVWELIVKKLIEQKIVD